jgi:SAM-dependent methyltransferase
MTPPVPTPPPLTLTGERTVPGVLHENYWFRRHEAVYAAVPHLVRTDAAPAVVLDAGSGEGYGATLLASSFPEALVVGVDYDTASCAHARATHATTRTAYVQGLVTALPIASSTAEVVVSLQVVEHIWNPDGYVRELARVCRPGGVVVLSTPNRLAFSPGLGRKERPDNVFHCREYDAEELVESVTRWAPDLVCTQVVGLRHGARLAAWEARHGSLVTAQLATPAAQWPTGLAELVASVDTGDFALTGGTVDDSLDLVVVLRKSA